ncbi:hypothetical protein BBB02_03740 [Wolbachia endosymbiont of Bemisia tabaci]|uniref:head-tail joining protein n=1 Tax=Wolbachia endosymbiont of Bemisia tabaci TaxID=215173 RepID=UPI000FD17210|nr:hypothetical protein [Wolbachia endosymbiont of Bemisia tabaci]AZU37142.1 hypothetical protein BBB02_00605 [Wolbachia endosymbiont of Bemisia tabaci]AZU37625.1 hypothetical protein BBB02_03740 [Wolbachia endosymbiont of Bemisia tabaci]
MNIGKLLKDCFEHLGVEAIYCNKNKEAIRKIKVLIKRPETTYSLGEDGALTQQIASIEICSEDVTSFSIGNYIKIEKRFYKIFELPLKDSSGKILKIEAIESV